MKVTAIIKRYKEKCPGNIQLWLAGDTEEIQEGIREYCCKEMEEAWENKYIGFGEFDSILNRNDDVNIYRCFPYPEGVCWEEMAITYCPFCGERIKIAIEDK